LLILLIGFTVKPKACLVDPLINLENFQKQKVYFGYYLAFNSFDFKIDYKTVGPDIQVKKNKQVNVGIVGDLKLQEYINLRFEPGLYYKKRFKLSHFSREIRWN
jgi:hypothetical protein